MHLEASLINNVILKQSRVLLDAPGAPLWVSYKVYEHLTVVPFASELLAAIIRTEIVVVPHPNHLDLILLDHLHVLSVFSGLLVPLQSIFLIKAGVLDEAGQLHLVCIDGIPEPDPQIWPLLSDRVENV